MNDVFDGFTIYLYLDSEGDYLAHFVELPTVSAFGKSPASAINELQAAWENLKQGCIDKDVPIPQAPPSKTNSGQINVRVDKRVHKLLAMEASRNGLSLIALVSQKLAESVEQV